ncbi:MAG: hypothetical protein ACYTAF_14600 [Planctomycetota bacterium]|jgi:hypothetical protein
MKGRAGFSLFEFVVATTMMAAIIAVTAVAVAWLYRAHDGVMTVYSDLEIAQRFLVHVKGDIARARSVGVKEREIALGFADDTERIYAFDPADHSVRSDGDGGPRPYVGAFENVRFVSADHRTVLIEVELKKRDEASPMRPRWASVVYCRNVED